MHSRRKYDKFSGAKQDFNKAKKKIRKSTPENFEVLKNTKDAFAGAAEGVKVA